MSSEIQKIAKYEILTALTSHVRVVSVEQVARMVKSIDHQQANRAVKKLKTSGQVERVGGLMVPIEYNIVPVFQWQAESDAESPNFESLAYTLKRRRTLERRHADLYRATPKAFRAIGLQPQTRPARRSDWEHDLGVTETWLSLRDEITANNRQWILEDDFSEEMIDAVCKPDAIIQSATGEIEFIEYGGCYSADTLRNKFESWWHIDWRLF